MTVKIKDNLPNIFDSTIAIIGLGYVGLPLAIEISYNKKCLVTGKKIVRQVIGYDINKKRIEDLKNKNDITSEITSSKLKGADNLYFTSEISELRNADIFIITVPTPIDKNNKPDLGYLKMAAKSVGQCLEKRNKFGTPLVIFESTVYPGATEEVCIPIIEKYSKYKIDSSSEKNNFKQFSCGYSPERINPGDKKHQIQNIKKILAIETNSKKIVKRFLTLYSKITKKIVISKSIEDAETAKVIENIQRDINIALMNDIFIFSKKMGLNFKNIVRLSRTKWNFLKFNPGLVGGHCLPVDPYYLNYIAKQNKIRLETVLAGRHVNEKMKNVIYNMIINKISYIKKLKKKNKILVVGVTYKNDVADLRNSYPLSIYLKLKKRFSDVFAYDYICNAKDRKKFNILNTISSIKKFDLIIFLVKHSKNIKIFNLAKKNDLEFLDPFDFYKSKNDNYK